MNRRDFLKTTGVLAGARLLPSTAVSAAAHRGAPRLMQIALMSTFIDWYFSWSPAKVGKAPLPWSPDAVKMILDRHAAAGNKTVY
jgi:hypothetical protein